MSNNNGFRLVQYKHPKQSKPTEQSKMLFTNTASQAQTGNNEKQLNMVIKYIENCKLEIKSSLFYEELIQAMPENISQNTDVKSGNLKPGESSKLFTDFVCYGIGQLSESPMARYQFALLLLLWQHFQPQGNCYIYDPVFSTLDKNIVKYFRMVLISKNEEARRKVVKKTLFFIPHGGKPLYNNVLWANWGPSLANIVVIGNSFHSYDERIPSSQLCLEAEYIARVLPITHEVKFPTLFHHEDIFNDLATHFFLENELQRQPCSFWKDCKEPVYEDDNTEIVLNASA